MEGTWQRREIKLAGRKQHYIPQAMLRAFEAARTGTKSQVLVFRKGRSAYLTSTEGAAAERDFYSNPLATDKEALDDKITNFEGEHLSPMLQELRSTESGEVDSELAAITVAHLAFRTAHVRGTMANMTGSVIGQMESIVESPAAMRRFAGIDSMASNTVLIEMVQEELCKNGLNTWTEKDRKVIERMAIFRLRERFDDLVVNAIDTIHGGLAAISAHLSGSIAKAHARVLSKSLVPQERVTALRALNWQIIPIDRQDRHFILPDCVAVASSKMSGELEPLAMLSLSEVATVIMPLSSRQILVGSVSTSQIAQTEINLQLARCSLEFFISSKRDEETNAIAESIGVFANKLTLDLLDEQVEDLPEEPPREKFTGKELVVRTPTGKFGDAAKKMLSAIAEEVVDPVSIDRIESITVPANMQSALKAIWKRIPTTFELQAAAMGTVEPFKSEQEWKCRVILPRKMAELLVQAGDQAKRLAAVRLVKINLGRAYYFDCWARRYTAIFDDPGLDIWNGIVLKIAFRAGAFYFGGLTAARHESEPLPGGDRLQELATFLRLGFSGLREARQRFFAHQNVDQLIFEAMQSVEIILTSIASVSGFLEAKGTMVARDSDAGKVLSAAELWEWSHLFAKDLWRHYEKRHGWASEEELRQLAGHVERLLWTIGVIVSQTNTGYWIDVLADERMAAILGALNE